ncbi:MAG: hypothetical protein FJZ47_14545 [Candidatus Tectomicrobia bacterium]|uniref:Glycosyltransferase n=1 Tax=Tectimicrobiota bacterium TaxID=2528274 RepID=A0A937W1B0_UNCTE|nr:hypothetical protein [Candidatus Tectomicrobia bacterium]
MPKRVARTLACEDAAIERAWQSSTPIYPRVTVQLPVYNEQYVLQRLVEAVLRLQYPRHCLEIQILDDSIDATTAEV